MKRFSTVISLFVLVAMLLGITSLVCAQDKIVVGFSQIGAESDWRTAETQSIKETAANDPEIELKFSDAQQKQQNQIKALRTFISQGVDVIAMAPVVETGWETVLKEAKDAGIPVILVDRGVSVDDESLYATFIGSDFVLEGKKAGAWLAADMNGEANIVELQGTVGAAPAIDRKEGFEQVIDLFPGMEIIASQSADFTTSNGKEVMEAMLKSHGDKIDALYAHNDNMALGAVQAIKEYGLNPGEDIKIVGVDGVKAAFEAMIQGDYNLTVECNPLLGPQVFDAAKKLAAGKDVPKWIKSNEGIYPQSVAKEAYPNRKY